MISKLERLEKEFGKPTQTKDDFRRIVAKPAATLTDFDLVVIEHFAGESTAQVTRDAREVALGTRPRTPLTAKGLADVVTDAIKLAVGPLWTRLRTAEATIKTIAELERRIVELEARPTLRDAGVWQANREYRNGDVVSHQGGGWLCRSTHMSVGSHPSPDAFRLFVKAGERK
jgi:hypothetical protein